MEDYQGIIEEYYTEKGLDAEALSKLAPGFLLALGYGLSTQVEERGK